MKEGHLDSFILSQMECPSCAAPIQAADGALRCTGCGHTFPIVNGVPRFVSSDEYTKTFSLEWKRHPRTQLDSHNGWRLSEDEFRRLWPFPAEELAGKLVLDAGCGTGRFAEIALKLGARVVGVDLSYAIDVAHDNFGTSERFFPIQADLTRLPFRSETFDYIYSFGVLHHTPNPRGTFERLVPLLKRGGGISINVYSDYNKPHVALTKFYRKLVRIMGPEAFWYASYGLAGLHYISGIAPLRAAVLALAPLRIGPTFRWTHLDTFDWYTPTFMSFHNYREIDEWFHGAGLVDWRVGTGQVALFGRKPA